MSDGYKLGAQEIDGLGISVGLHGGQFSYILFGLPLCLGAAINSCLESGD